MVHLQYQLNFNGNNYHEVLIEGIQKFINHHHHYTPIDTTEGRDTQSTELANYDPGNYVRSANLWEKDEWGRGKAYIEYGWRENPDRVPTTSFQGHWDEHKCQLPYHPADFIFTLRVRHITDWSAKEQAELDGFISGMIDDCDGAFKTRDQYTEEEVSWFLSAMDYGLTCARAETACIKGNISCPAEDVWVCRACKQTYNRTEVPPHNASPLPFPPEEKVCEGCNSTYVLAGRMGNNPFNSFECLEDRAIKCPFIYPKPKMTRDEFRAKRDDPNSMFFIAGDGKMEWNTTEMMKKQWSAQVLNLSARNSGLTCELEKAYETRANQQELAQAFNEGKRAMKEELKDEIKRNKELGKEILDKQAKMEEAMMRENARLEEQAQSVKRAMERLKQANAPMEKKVQQLKEDIARRDNKIASMKWMEGYVADMPPKMRLRMCLRQMMRQRSRPVSPVVDWVNELPAWAITDYRHEASLRANAPTPAPVQRKKRPVVEAPCIICEKMFPKNSLVEKNGDLWCRICK